MRLHDYAGNGFGGADNPRFRSDIRSGLGVLPPVYRGPSALACGEAGNETRRDREARQGRFGQAARPSYPAPVQWLRRVLGLDLRARVGDLEGRTTAIEQALDEVTEAFERAYDERS